MSSHDPTTVVLRGVIRSNTIWPDGSSDADTLRLFVDPTTPWAWIRQAGRTRVLRGLERAVVHGTVVRPVLSGANAVTVRLEGVDAPELHYRAPSPARHDLRDDEPHTSPTYRQPFGEYASAALRTFFRTFGESVPVEVTSQVESISDAFDTYGRFIGNVHVLAQPQPSSVNRWLIKQGLAFPAFYTSTPEEQIRELTRLAKQACQRELGIWSYYSIDIRPACRTRLYRGKHVALRAETASVYLPKLFRRRVAWYESNIATGNRVSFYKYLEAREDSFVRRDEFLSKRAHPADKHQLAEALCGTELVLNPWDFVFDERPAQLRFR